MKFFSLFLILGLSLLFAKVNINTASLEELQSLKGIGAKTAQAIIKERNKKKFKTIEELKNIKGIGEKRFLNIKAELSL